MRIHGFLLGVTFYNALFSSQSLEKPEEIRRTHYHFDHNVVLHQKTSIFPVRYRVSGRKDDAITVLNPRKIVTNAEAVTN